VIADAEESGKKVPKVFPPPPANVHDGGTKEAVAAARIP